MFYRFSRPPRHAADMLCLWLRVLRLEEDNDSSACGDDDGHRDGQSRLFRGKSERWWSADTATTDANTASTRAAESRTETRTSEAGDEAARARSRAAKDQKNGNSEAHRKGADRS